jgi:hypothetical protein
VLGRHRPRSAAYDHYCSELLALYVCRIACLEIGVVRDGLARKPQCGLAGAGEVNGLVDDSVAQIDYFWFFGGLPTDYDRVMTANYLTFQTLDENFRYRKVIDPRSLSVDQIGHLPSPLGRLIGMHQSFREITTGIGYGSPWERQDADWNRS